MRFLAIILVFVALLSFGKAAREIIDYEGIYEKLGEIISEKYSDDPDLARGALNNLKKNEQVKGNFTADLIDNKFKLKTLMMPSIESYEKYYRGQRALFDDFRKYVVQWHPHFAPFMNKLVNFLWQQKIVFYKIKAFTASKNELEEKLTPYIEAYDIKNPGDVASMIEEHFKNILKDEFKMNSTMMNQTFNEIVRSGKPKFRYEFYMLFNATKLIKIIDKHQEKINPRINPRRGPPTTVKPSATPFQKLQTTLNSWYPHNEVINSHLVGFLQSKRVNPSTINNIASNKSKFPTSIKPFLNEFSSTKRAEYEKHLYQQTDVLLRKLKPLKAQQILLELKGQKFETQFKPEMLYNLTALNETVAGEILRLSYDKCLVEMKTRIASIVEKDQPDSDKLDAMKDHFEAEKCVLKELCIRQDDYTDTQLKRELKPYIDIFTKTYDGDEFTSNVNIRDEIDETIYEVIQIVLVKKKGFMADKADCVVKYMKRVNNVDPHYTPGLLFDEERLLRVLDPLVKDYEKLYAKV